MPSFTTEQLQAEVTVHIQDLVVAVQVWEKLLKTGAVVGGELNALAIVRSRLVDAIHKTTGMNWDDPATWAPAPEKAPEKAAE